MRAVAVDRQARCSSDTTAPPPAPSERGRRPTQQRDDIARPRGRTRQVPDRWCDLRLVQTGPPPRRSRRAHRRPLPAATAIANPTAMRPTHPTTQPELMTIAIGAYSGRPRRRDENRRRDGRDGRSGRRGGGCRPASPAPIRRSSQPKTTRNAARIQAGRRRLPRAETDRRLH